MSYDKNKIITSSSNKKYAVAPSADKTLLSRDELRRIDRAVDTTNVKTTHRSQLPPSSKIPSLPFQRVNTSGDEVLGLVVQPVNEKESALNVTLRFVAPEEFNLPELQDPPSALPLARRLGALLKGAESVTTTWNRQPILLREETTSKTTALKDAETRVAAALRAGQPDRAAKLQCLIGSLHYNSSNTQMAVGGFEKALASFEQSGDVRGVAFCQSMLGACNVKLGKYKTALVHYKQQETLGAAYSAAVAQTNMGVCYIALDDLQFAVQAFEDALQSAKASGDTMLETIAEGNLGLVSLKVRNMRSAQTHLEICLEQCSAAGDKSGASICLLMLGELYYLMNDYPHALFYYEHAYRIGGEAGSADIVNLARIGIGLTRGGATIREAVLRQAAAMGASQKLEDVVNLLPA